MRHFFRGKLLAAPSQIIIGVLLFHLCYTSAAAQETDTSVNMPDMEQVEQAWKRNDFVFVRNALEQISQSTGSAVAQYRYGRVLLEGRGGPRDIDGAVMWLQRAVDQNNAVAAALLARVYISRFDTDGEVKTQYSAERAADLLNLSATLGFAEGQFMLAQLYAAGNGVAKDEKAAFRWYLAAAQQQNVKAQFELARAYSRGIGTAKDLNEAIRWLGAAAGNNHAQAQLSLARAYEMGNGVQSSARTALKLYRQAAENGVVAAQQILGVRLLTGVEGVAPDPQAGVRWLEAAAKQGAPEAMVSLGKAYSRGTGVAQDDTQAARWYLKAAQYEHGHAKTAMAGLYEDGRGVEVDLEAAIELYQQALTLPDGNTAVSHLGRLAAQGVLDDRFAAQRMVPWVLAALRADEAAAEPWMLLQAQAGLREAQSGLAAYYLSDPSTAPEGVIWLQRAAEGGDTGAMMRLGRMLMVGDQVALDYVLAHQWINIAATFGMLEAPELRETLTALMTADQLAQAQAGARDWLATGQPQPPKTVQTVKTVPLTDAGRN